MSDVEFDMMKIEESLGNFKKTKSKGEVSVMVIYADSLKRNVKLLEESM